MKISNLIERGILIPNEEYPDDSDYQYIPADDYIINVTELFEDFVLVGLKKEGDKLRFCCVEDDFDMVTKLVIKPSQSFKGELYKRIE